MNKKNTTWDANQYLKFENKRLRPALELLDRIPLKSPKKILDLGCGTGNVTKIISERWQSSKVIGLDSSQQMLEKAQKFSSEITWQLQDINSWNPDETFDLIYSNATLHWVKNHTEIFSRLLSKINKNGFLAIQMPLNQKAPSHALMSKVLTELNFCSEEFRENLWAKAVEEPSFYYDLLAPKVKMIDIWTTTYYQIMEGENPIYEWVKSTGLRPVLKNLTEMEKEIFIPEYQKRLRIAYPKQKDRKTIFPFTRLFIVAQV
ncbi:MAG: methyltransferase domain-containing protein [Calditrichaeota bacterium]|nr:MAG: methyltransferase domain-containing protein [Calditrichota bacterium]